MTVEELTTQQYFRLVEYHLGNLKSQVDEYLDASAEHEPSRKVFELSLFHLAVAVDNLQRAKGEFQEGRRRVSNKQIETLDEAFDE